MIDRREFKGTSKLTLLQTLIEEKLEEFKEYLNEISYELKIKQQEVNKNHIQSIDNVNPDLLDEVDLHFEDDIRKYFKTFPIYTYNPLLLIIYGQFENWLKMLCELDNKKGLSKVTFKNLSGNSDIERSRLYLEIIAEIHLDDTEDIWKKILQIQKMRNAIAHNNSNILKNKSVQIKTIELYQLLSNDKRIQFDDIRGDFYIKDPEFILEVIELISYYMNNVIEKVKARNVIAKNILMRYNNADWGIEKTEILLKELIYCLSYTDSLNGLNDIDSKNNLISHLNSMANNLTKLYSFFSGGEWDVSDKDYIVNQREEGLKRIKKIYGIKK